VPDVSLPIEAPELPVPVVSAVVESTVAQVNEALPHTRRILTTP